MTSNPELPLQGITVLELTQNVMGPTCGLILADMGADVIRIEKTDGDDTRRLKGFARGFYGFYNRNKKSLCLDLKSDEGKGIVRDLVKEADVFIENFAPGTIERLGFGYETVREINPAVIFCSMKGFMKGPYEKRAALDEVVQMMSGLAYMTGPRNKPLRAGASVVDVMGGTYAALGIITALYQRQVTGAGTYVVSTLFESAAFLMGQHMANEAITGVPVPPMPERGRAWSIYDLFTSSEGDRIFIGITSDRHWQRFCRAFGFDDLCGNEKLATNNSRLDEREWLIVELENRVEELPLDEILKRCEEAEIPYGKVSKPGDLFDDPQMNAEGNLVETELEGGIKAKLPSLPLRIGSWRQCDKGAPPRINEGASDILRRIGIDGKRAEELRDAGILAPLED